MIDVSQLNRELYDQIEHLNTSWVIIYQSCEHCQFTVNTVDTKYCYNSSRSSDSDVLWRLINCHIDDDDNNNNNNNNNRLVYLFIFVFNPWDFYPRGINKIII